MFPTSPLSLPNIRIHLNLYILLSFLAEQAQGEKEKLSDHFLNIMIMSTNFIN